MENEGTGQKTYTIRTRTLQFSVLIIQLTNLFPRTAAGFALADQLVRSGTSIGANVEEAQDANSRKEFIYCLTVALKEARETYYWLKVVKESDLVSLSMLDQALQEASELVKILTTIVKNSKLKND